LILVDTNVILDLLTADPVWMEWSRAQLRAGAMQDALVINAVIYAELAARYDTEARLNDAVGTLEISIETIPRQALFAAGQAFRHYRSRGGVKTGVLPDFFIGAHAAATGMPLLTRDRRRYASYFPAVQLIAPDEA
jgi:predicted nucleic acid-binding protein